MASQEDLDIRMEKIRIKNEEIEKKHKEAQIDLNIAKENKALVSTKGDSSEDWPKEHKYDNLEFDYDVADKDKLQPAEPSDVPDKTNQPILLSRSGRELNDLPPDPAYNFLRDDERENKPRAITNNQQGNQKKPFNKNRNRNRQDRPKSNNEEGILNSPDKSSQQQNQEPKPYRPGGYVPPYLRHSRPNQGPQNDKGAAHAHGPPQPRRAHPQQLRSERRSAPAAEGEPQQQQHHQHQSGNSPPNQQRRQNRPKPKKETITVSTDGEVRSVKLTPTGEKTFGSGRVAHSRPEKNQKFPADPTDPENANDIGDNVLQQDKSEKPSSRNRNHNRNRKGKLPNPEFQHPILDKIIIPKTSVQERLLRVTSSEKEPEPSVSVTVPPSVDDA